MLLLAIMTFLQVYFTSGLWRARNIINRQHHPDATPGKAVQKDDNLHSLVWAVLSFFSHHSDVITSRHSALKVNQKSLKKGGIFWPLEK